MNNPQMSSPKENFELTLVRYTIIDVKRIHNCPAIIEMIAIEKI